VVVVLLRLPLPSKQQHQPEKGTLHQKSKPVQHAVDSSSLYSNIPRKFLSQIKISILFCESSMLTFFFF
jgi:hypothetical protein